MGLEETMNTHINDDLAAGIRRARGQQLGDLLRRSAARSPNKLALVFRDHRDTFRELDEVVNRTANALAALGISKGERIALLSRNSRAFVILRFALARIGAVTTPVNFMLNAEDVAYILAHSGARGLICQDSLCDMAETALSMMDGGPDLLFSIDHAGDAVSDLWAPIEPLFDHPDASEPWVDVGPDDPIQMMYTSGTESRPKGAMLTSGALYAQYVTVITDGEMRADATELHCLPLFHCAQLDCFLTIDLYLGATSILHDGADPAAMLETIEREKVNKLFCPPTVWIALLRHPDFDTRDLSSLEQGYYGASIMPTAVIEELSARLPNMRLYNFYGQTEMAPCATILRPEEQLTKLGSAGRPGINVETRVVDDEGNPVPVGEVGEIVHRSPHLILGYYNDPEKTAEAFKGGWFHSGDLGRFDEDGYLYVVDRKKDMIKSGGENVASREVEEAIFRHPKIVEVAVFGVPHPKWIEAVTAVVVPKDGAILTVEEIDAYCRETLSHFKSPKHVSIRSALPKNASGKILKRELRLEFETIFDA
ncbi:acyl-CoA synthetase [Pseudodonghicola xiamenensis]|uniref:3-methylmercaptopropionyl-CoA ligase n=2 Tax=Pseudodonghicola xiamenensis TaxID=337702 RepID=A0A8J3HB55_9RHOB|nr:acyl-CoA synthetase [Pseudodonghicola xiamenensis]